MCKNMDILLKFNFCRKVQQKRKSQQKPEEISLKAEMRSQLKVGVATRSLFVQLIPSYDISRTSLEEEIEGLFKRSRDLKFKWRPEMTKGTSDKGCDQESVVETKGINQGRISGRDTTLMSRRQLKTTELRRQSKVTTWIRK